MFKKKKQALELERFKGASALHLAVVPKQTRSGRVVKQQDKAAWEHNQEAPQLASGVRAQKKKHQQSLPARARAEAGAGAGAGTGAGTGAGGVSSGGRRGNAGDQPNYRAEPAGERMKADGFTGTFQILDDEYSHNPFQLGEVEDLTEEGSTEQSPDGGIQSSHLLMLASTSSAVHAAAGSTTYRQAFPSIYDAKFPAGRAQFPRQQQRSEKTDVVLSSRVYNKGGLQCDVVTQMKQLRDIDCSRLTMLFVVYDPARAKYGCHVLIDHGVVQGRISQSTTAPAVGVVATTGFPRAPGHLPRTRAH